MMLYVDLVDVRGFGGLVLRSLRNPLEMFVIFDLWPRAQTTYGGIRFIEGQVGPCLAVDHTTGALVGGIVVDDAGA